MLTAEQLARECGVPRVILLRNARTMRMPRKIDEKGKFIFDDSQSRMLRMILKENVLTDELKKKIKDLIFELLENTPAGYVVRLQEIKNFLITEHIKRDFCQYGFLYQILDSKDFILFSGTTNSRTVVALSDRHEFTTDEASDERMNRLMPYYSKETAKYRAVN